MILQNHRAMKKLIISFMVLLGIMIFDGCSKEQLQNVVGEAIEEGVTQEEVAIGLKSALIIGINRSFYQASQPNGFYNNKKIRIGFPEEAEKVESTLRRIGLSNQVDNFIIQLNRGAEKATYQAKPIFIETIDQMDIEDAWTILRGDQDAATQYLRINASAKLYQQFAPIVKRNLDEVKATYYYKEIINRYNRLPSVQKVNPNLEEYATKRAMAGLFYLIAKEEERIRENPTARTTSVIRKVFAHQ